ncbi:flagellar basal body-associated FliL family protein [Aquicoccus sp. SU-CL01552]|uniref:flagellar basal body-associated FliL family protein n=1 Tax=Aquicoccus sp. SU-CL01552 TaxID=3127656 RepID=UPI003104CB8F
MAKPAKKNPRPASTEPDEATAKNGKARSARTLLMAALLLSVASLGGGFFLARIAFQQDAANFAPDYIDETGDKSADAGQDPGHADMADTGSHGAAGEDATKPNDGVLEFEEIVTNIESYDAKGRPEPAFLKLSLVLVYRPDPGASELMKERQPFMRDLFTGYARSLTETDVRGMAGVLNVKAELLKRARAAAGSDLPQEILISDLIVQ